MARKKIPQKLLKALGQSTGISNTPRSSGRTVAGNAVSQGPHALEAPPSSASPSAPRLSRSLPNSNGSSPLSSRAASPEVPSPTLMKTEDTRNSNANVPEISGTISGLQEGEKPGLRGRDHAKEQSTGSVSSIKRRRGRPLKSDSCAPSYNGPASDQKLRGPPTNGLHSFDKSTVTSRARRETVSKKVTKVSKRKRIATSEQSAHMAADNEAFNPDRPYSTEPDNNETATTQSLTKSKPLILAKVQDLFVVASLDEGYPHFKPHGVYHNYTDANNKVVELFGKDEKGRLDGKRGVVSLGVDERLCLHYIRNTGLTKSLKPQSSNFVGTFRVPYFAPDEDAFVKPWPKDGEMNMFYEKSDEKTKKLIRKMGLR